MDALADESDSEDEDDAPAARARSDAQAALEMEDDDFTQALKVCRMLQAYGEFEMAVSSTDYRHDDRAEREAHAARVAEVGREFLKRRGQALPASEHACSVYDVVILHKLPADLRRWGHIIVHGREDGQEKKNQEAKAISRRCVRRLTKFVSYVKKNGTRVDVQRTMSLQIAERVALKEQVQLRMGTYVKHLAVHASGHWRQDQLDQGYSVKRARSQFTSELEEQIAKRGKHDMDAWMKR